MNYDVIIAGAGAAGLYAAINLPSDAKILLITKRELGLCNTALAQGGIAGVYNSPEDKTSLHENDTYIAGGFQNNHKTVHMLVEEAAQDIGRIIELGVDFDKQADGDYHRTLEGGHSRRRIFPQPGASDKGIHHNHRSGSKCRDRAGQQHGVILFRDKCPVSFQSIPVNYCLVPSRSISRPGAACQ